MATCPKLRSQDRKRQHIKADLLQENISLSSKRFKTAKERPSASNFSPQFYDSLSKVWLTRRALRELDRRNQLKNSVCARAPTHKPVRRFSNGRDLQRLRRFARLGGPKLDDLRGYPEPTKFIHTMGSKHSSRSPGGDQSKSTKSISNSISKTSNTESCKRRSSAYDEDFEQYLFDSGIYMNNQKSKPSNINEIRQRLAQPRPSLSPSRFSEGAFEKFQQSNEDIINKANVMRRVLPTIYGNAKIPNHGELVFTQLKSITNEATVDAQPDFYDGEHLKRVDRLVQENLSPYIIPTKHRMAPVAPNFFLEAKTPDGGADTVKRQITHDLALGARGMHQLQSYGAGEPVYDNNAYSLGATYHAGTGTLQIYASHVTPTGPGGSSEYHTTQIGGNFVIGSRDQLLQGAAVIRNGREVAMEWRNQFISAANEKARFEEPSTLTSSKYNDASNVANAYPVQESQTSTDDLEEPEPSHDELAPSFYPDINLFSCPAAPSYSRESVHDGSSDVTEESEISADELALDTPVNPTPSKKRLCMELKNIVSQAPRHATSGRRWRSRR